MQKVSFYQTINLGFFSLIVPFLAEIPDLTGGLQQVSVTLTVFVVVIFQVLA